MKNESQVRFEALMPSWQLRVEQALEGWLPRSDLHPTRLHDAMRYAVMGGGKRVRPMLVYATGVALEVAPRQLDGAACAVELIHTYSLVHDDLPAMDDDDLRRGRPTCHRAYDEATAILAGDALQALAFYILTHDPALTSSAEARLRMVETLAVAAGSRGMCGGQALDLAAVGNKLNIAELEDMHIHKTGALIRAATHLAAMTTPLPDQNVLKSLDHYAQCVGLAFQIRDDILDVEASTEILGKRQGADQALGKPTYATLLGVAAAKERARLLHEEALSSLAMLGAKADVLRGLSHYLIARSH